MFRLARSIQCRKEQKKAGYEFNTLKTKQEKFKNAVFLSFLIKLLFPYKFVCQFFSFASIFCKLRNFYRSLAGQSKRENSAR